MYQNPALLVKDIRQSKAGDLLVVGLDVTKIHDPERDIEDCTRHYRLDRILSTITDLGRIDCPYLDPHPDEEGYIAL